tara:strand:- start:431 stop:2980 length:2550 start_codon:yes stop_codon:yes gene_type:complete
MALNASSLSRLLVELAQGPASSASSLSEVGAMTPLQPSPAVAPWTMSPMRTTPLPMRSSSPAKFLDPTSATMERDDDDVVAAIAEASGGGRSAGADAGTVVVDGVRSLVVPVEVPAGVSVGQHFDTTLPDGRVVNVVVPPFHGNEISEDRHVRAGLHFSILVPVSRERAAVRAARAVADVPVVHGGEGSDEEILSEEEEPWEGATEEAEATEVVGDDDDARGRLARGTAPADPSLLRAVRSALLLIVSQHVQDREQAVVATHERELDRLNKLFLERLRISKDEVEHEKYRRGECSTRQHAAERSGKKAHALRAAAEKDRDEWRVKYESAEGENEDQRSYALTTWQKTRAYEEATRAAEATAAAATVEMERLAAALIIVEAERDVALGRCVLLEQRAAKAHIEAAQVREDAAAAQAKAAAEIARALAETARVTKECEQVVAASRIALQKAISSAAPSADELELRERRREKNEAARKAAADKAAAAAEGGGNAAGGQDAKPQLAAQAADAIAAKNLADRERRQRLQEKQDDAADDAIRVLIREARIAGPEQLVGACREHATSLPCQIRGAREIKELARTSDEGRVALAKAGAITALIHAMRTHADSCPLLCIACRALTNLAFGSDENRVEIVHAGGAGAVIAAMQRHPQIAELQARCCATLSNIAHNNDAHRIAVVQAGALVATLAASTRFAGDTSVQSAANRLLLVLAVNDAIAREALRCGAVKAITKGMRSCALHIQTQRYACWALANIAWQHLRDDGDDITSNPNNECVQRAKEAGSAAAVRAALNRFGHDAQLVERAQLALEKLSLREAHAFSEENPASTSESKLFALEHSFGRANVHGFRSRLKNR